MKRFFLSLAMVLAFALAAKSQNYIPDKERNLCIIYFVPKNMTAPAGYQERLSKVMRYIQQWYGNQMKLNGYTDASGNGKTFGLIQDAAAERVQITEMQAAETGDKYGNGSASGGKIIAEVDAFLAANPGLKTSQHVLIFYPQLIPGGPSNGYFPKCVLADEPLIDIAQVGNNTGNGYPVARLGAVAHELGHALNLPHDASKKSDYNKLSTGVSLMGAGTYNFTRTDKPAFFTATDCAILNTNEIFNANPNTQTTYYGAVNAAITSVHAIYDLQTRTIKVSGRYVADVPVKSVVLYNDPNYENEGVGTNKDYNAITWETKPIGTDSFYVEVPIDEFVIKYPYEAEGSNPYIYPWEMKVNTVHSNGTVKENIYYFKFNDEIPILPYSIPVNNTAVARTGWTATAGNKTINNVTFVDQSEVAQNMLDNDLSTYWHSKWYSFPSGVTANAYPHEFVVDTKAKRNYVGWSYHHRSGNQTMAKTADLYGSDDNSNWTLIKNYTFEGQAGVRYFQFDSYKNFRYFKFVALTSFSGVHTAIADFKMYTGPDPSLAPAIPAPTLLVKTGWTVKAGTKTRTDNTTFEDENNVTTTGNERAESVIDNNTVNYWHSKYSGETSANRATYPHQLTIDTKSVQRVTAWSYNQRVGLARSIKDIDVLVSDDDINYTLVGSYTLLNNETTNKITFGVRQFRYFRLVAKNAYDNDIFASLAEVSLYNDPTNTTLPVELTAFNAKSVASTVKLSWTTASESNSAYFDVMRLTDSKNALSVGKISAAGNSLSKLNYSYTDFNPLPGTSYYQLNQYDKDGKLATKSEIVAVSILENPRQLTVQSVTAGEVIFNVYSAQPGTTSFYITNVVGQRLATKTVNLTAGNNQFTLPVNGIGMHILTADFKTERISKKFIK